MFTQSSADIVLTYDMPLFVNLPREANYTVIVDGQFRTVTDASVVGSTVILETSILGPVGGNSLDYLNVIEVTVKDASLRKVPAFADVVMDIV